MLESVGAQSGKSERGDRQSKEVAITPRTTGQLAQAGEADAIERKEYQSGAGAIIVIADGLQDTRMH